jgi:hypothetical protein
MPETPSNLSEFDAQAAGQALGTQPHASRDVAHGDGDALTVGETTLEVYPDAGVARVTTPDARIELFRVPNYAISGERVVFEEGTEDDRTRLQVRADGKVAFHPILRATETSRTPDTTSSGHQDSPAGQVTAETPTGSQTPQAPEGEKNGEVEQQILLGRLGRDPWFIPREGDPVAGFPFAVNDEQGRTTWHKVVVTGELAEQVAQGRDAGQFKKGRLVQLSGTPVTRKEDNGKGGTRTVTEFHATSAVRMKNTTVPHPQGR